MPAALLESEEKTLQPLQDGENGLGFYSTQSPTRSWTRSSTRRPRPGGHRMIASTLDRRARRPSRSRPLRVTGQLVIAALVGVARASSC